MVPRVWPKQRRRGTWLKSTREGVGDTNTQYDIQNSRWPNLNLEKLLKRLVLFCSIL